MQPPEFADTAALQRRLERERRARREAEAIAERVTGELYASKGALQTANAELEGLNQSLREFVAIASHDLRGPLTSILGLSRTMTARWKDLADDKRIELLNIIERQADHMARMVEDLLTVSRIDAGQIDPHAEAVKLREAVESLIGENRYRQDQIRVEVGEGWVFVDPHHLQRILSNFLNNALKHGLPPVGIEETASGPWAEVRIRDHGDGVPPEFVPRLFGRFARGDNARTQGGTGLGLSIVQGLAQANGGETWYETNEPRGSCFVVKLPRSDG